MLAKSWQIFYKQNTREILYTYFAGYSSSSWLSTVYKRIHIGYSTEIYISFSSEVAMGQWAVQKD